MQGQWFLPHLCLLGGLERRWMELGYNKVNRVAAPTAGAVLDVTSSPVLISRFPGTG